MRAAVSFGGLITVSRKNFVCLVFLSIAPGLFADQVVLKNGDTITGAIVKKDGAKLTIKSEFLGEVTMPWTAVKSLRSDADLTVVLPGGESVLGKVNTSGDKLEVVTATATRSAPFSDVSALRNGAEQKAFDRLQHPGFLELWTGSYDMGLALARGNAHTETLTNAFSATRITRKDKITVTFNEIYATARVNTVSTTGVTTSTTNTTASAVRGAWTYSRDLTPRFFVSTLNDYEHDRFQNLNLRFVAGGDYQHESFIANLSRNSGEANFGDDFLHKFSSTTSITQSLRFFPNLTYTGDYRLNFDLSMVTLVKKWLGWHLTASDRFISNPVFGAQKNDILLSTGFRLSFAK